jgi:DMSO/TMAO reductase YedYZ molybdopterin-dependent catalytic subunit
MRLERTDFIRTLERRKLLRGTLSLGAASLLAGCDFSDEDGVHRFLAGLSRWNDRAQAALFGPALAPTFSEAEAVKDFRYNAFFGPEDSPVLDAADYKLELSGLIGDKRPWTVDQLHALPNQQSQITRHVCVEGWSMIGKWTGVPLSDFLKRIDADTRARYVAFQCADGYYGSIDMASALHPQTIMAFKLSDEILPRQYGYPFKVRIPTKLGFKNPKWVTTMYVTNRFPGGFWEDRGYNWFSGL